MTQQKEQIERTTLTYFNRQTLMTLNANDIMTKTYPITFQ